MESIPKIQEYISLIEKSFSSDPSIDRKELETRLNEFYTNIADRTRYTLMAIEHINDEQIQLGLVINLKFHFKSYCTSMTRETNTLKEVLQLLFISVIKNELSMKVADNLGCTISSVLDSNIAEIEISSVQTMFLDITNFIRSQEALNFSHLRNILMFMTKVISSKLIRNNNVMEVNNEFFSLTEMLLNKSEQIVKEAELSKDFEIL